MRKQKRSQKNTEEVCMCRVHIQTDKGRKDALPCVGHGKGCPCFTEQKITKVKQELDNTIKTNEVLSQIAEPKI